MLEAIVSFLPSEGHGAIGALDWTPQERAKLAKEVSQCLTGCSIDYESILFVNIVSISSAHRVVT